MLEGRRRERGRWRRGSGRPRRPAWDAVKLPPPRLVKENLRTIRAQWRRDRVGEAAAALTFYGILALFPFLLLMVALARLVISPAQVQALLGALGRELPVSLSRIPSAQLAQLTSGSHGGLLTFSALTAIWSATAGVVSLITALNAAYGVTERRPRWKVYGLALGVVVAAAVLAPLAGFVAVAAPAIAARLGSPWTALVVWLRLPVAMLLMMTLWATIYSLLPDTQQKFKFISAGSVIGVLVWLAATLGFSFYVSRFNTFGITYGALGGIVVLLLWMWISSLALMLGAEINASLTRHAAGESG